MENIQNWFWFKKNNQIRIKFHKNGKIFCVFHRHFPQMKLEWRELWKEDAYLTTTIFQIWVKAWATLGCEFWQILTQLVWAVMLYLVCAIWHSYTWLKRSFMPCSSYDDVTKTFDFLELIRLLGSIMKRFFNWPLFEGFLHSQIDLKYTEMVRNTSPKGKRSWTFLLRNFFCCSKH